MKKTMSILVAAVVALCVLNARAEFKTVIGKSTSNTEVVSVIPEKAGSQIVIRAFEAYGESSAAVCTWRVPQAQYRVRVVSNALASATAVYIPADAVGSAKVGGYTVTTNDWILLPQTSVSGGWKPYAMTGGVATNGGLAMLTLTTSAITDAVAAQSVAYVVRAADRVSTFPAIGAASVSRKDLLAGGVGAPVLFGVTGTNSVVGVMAEYVQ